MSNETGKDQSGQLGTDTHDLVDQDKDNTNIVDSETEKQDTVQYKTHQKLLNQFKNQKSELEELREYRRKNEEDRLQKEGKYEELLKLREQKIGTLESELLGIKKDRIEARKLNAVINKLPGKIKRDEYLSFLDTETIQVDPETGEVDELSLDNAVNKFVTNYGDLIQPSNPKGLPSVGHLGGKPNLKRRLKDLSDDELKKAWFNAESKG